MAVVCGVTNYLYVKSQLSGLRCIMEPIDFPLVTYLKIEKKKQHIFKRGLLILKKGSIYIYKIHFSSFEMYIAWIATINAIQFIIYTFEQWKCSIKQ